MTFYEFQRLVRRPLPKFLFIKMKLIVLLLLINIAGSFAGSYAQNISLDVKEQRLVNVMQSVQQQSNYRYFLRGRDLAGLKVSANINDQPLSKAMDAILKDLPAIWSIEDGIIVIRSAPVKTVPLKDMNFKAPEEEVPERDIRGKVTDKDGNALTGATITVRETKETTFSDSDGNFNLKTKAQSGTLEITFVGYEPKVLKMGSTTFFNVVLELKPSKIDNIVITGYQVLKKENFTGTATTVTGDELKRTNPSNMLQALQSFDPSFKITENNILGSDPNRLPAINVRGSTALPAGDEGLLDRNNLSTNVNLPTFILDGFEVSLQKVYDLDINRIQSVTLLKDAAATAIYGSRAANGVLVIVTVPPKEGKLQLAYNFEVNAMVPDLSDYHVLNTEEKLEYERLAGLYNTEKNAALSQDQLDVLYYQKKKNVVGGVNTYWLSQPVKTAVGQKHSLFVEGGSSAIRYGVEMRYQTSPGVMKGSYRDRYSLGMNLTYNPSSKFSFRNVLTVSQVKSAESPYGNFNDYVRMNPYYPMTDSLGNIIQEIDNWTDRNTPNGSIQTTRVLNPLYNATLNSFNKSSYMEIIDAFSAEWSIVSGLRLRSLLSLSSTNTELNNFVSPLSNEFYFYPTSQLANRGRYDYGALDETAFDGNVTLTYNKQISDHFFNLAAGSNIRTYLSDSKSFSAIGFTNDRFTNIGFANRYAENSSPGGNIDRDRLFGSFLGLNYSFKNKYLLDLSVRADGSSKFGSENKVAPFWAFGLGWNLHQEPFLESDFIDLLRVRASTGLTGAVSFPPYLSKTTFSYYSNNWYSTGVGAIVNQYGNENLQWQRTRNYDIGIDIGLFDNRITFSPRYYYKLTEGLLADIMLPPSTGFSSYKDNLGDMKNYGFEANMKYDVVKRKELTITFTANLVSNKNEIARISNALKDYNDKADEQQVTDEYRSVPLLRFKEGQSLNTIYAVRSLGIDPENGQEIFIKANDSLTYVWDVKDIVPIGDYTPKAEGFLGANIAWKNFLLSASLYYRFGGDTYNQTLADRVENADPRFNVDRRVLEQRWKQPGDHTFYKDIADLGTSFASQRFVQKDNLIELRSVYLSYDFEKRIYSHIGMKSLRLALTMNDIWRSSSVAVERGIQYPFARNFTFSVQTSF